MSEAYWLAVRDSGMVVPTERPLADSAAELVAMLGDPRPDIRDSLVVSILTSWLSSGAFDDSLAALGDGVLPGLRRGLGDDGEPSVYRRSYSALLLGRIIGRDNFQHNLDSATVLRWGDGAANWLATERDHRGWTFGHGWAHAIAHGADFLSALASSRHVATVELSVLLELIADRLCTYTSYAWRHNEPDRLALAVMTIFYRNLVDLPTIEDWLERIGSALAPPQDWSTAEWPTPVAHNILAFLRSLQLQLAVGVNARAEFNGQLRFPDQPDHRSDIVLLVLDQLRAADPILYRRS